MMGMPAGIRPDALGPARERPQSEETSMAAIELSRQGAHHRHRRAEYREYRLTHFGVFAFFLLVAIALRLAPRRWRQAVPELGGQRSVWREAKVAASSCIPFAYR